MWMESAQALSDRLLAQRDRWPLWLPVFFGIGIGLYFALPVEPWIGLGAIPCLGLAAGLWAMRRSTIPFAVLAASLAMGLGFSAAQIRTAWVAAPVLGRNITVAVVEGVIDEVEMLPDGGQRLTIEDLLFDRPDLAVPARIRIRLKPVHGTAAVGDRIRVRAMLMGPPQPVMPGAFDFARWCWYKQFGAVGSALGPPEILRAGETSSWLRFVNGVRHNVTARIQAVLPGDTGAVAAALTSGDQMPISAPMMQAYRDSGLAHILSISGLHITMAAGLVFVGLRTLLALIPAIALRHPIKKWSAALAIGFAWFYTLLAGSPVPALRSFYMTGLILVAVLLDRVALSMRLVAWAAVAVMVAAPDEMIGPSFQMSFAAVVALIAAYETLTPKQAEWRSAHPGWMAGTALYVFGVVMSTLIAGTATAIYGVYHFNRFAVWSVAANMLAVPLTGFWVMPWALLMFLLMPLGLEAIALVPMGWGVAGVNWIAKWVAGWPSSAINVPVMPLWGLVVFTLGGCWLVIWRGPLRWWGLAPMAVAFLGMALYQPPDLLIDGRGDGLAVRTQDGRLLQNGKGGRILKESWARRAGPEAPERWPKRSSSRDGRLRCDESGCLWRVADRVVALVRDEDEPEAACAGADVVISRVPIRGACRGPRLVVDRFDLWRKGPHVLWFEADTIRVETVAGWQGDRPWSWRPQSRKKPQEAPPPTPPKSEEKDGEDED
jgi:competence protein ComEC